MIDTPPAAPKGKELCFALLPVFFLILSVAGVILAEGASSVVDYAPLSLLGASLAGFATYAFRHRLTWRSLIAGQRRSASQILSAIPVLCAIGMIATTWMLSGIVPGLIYLGLTFINASYFLPVASLACAIISVLLGSSWTTIATIGVAFMGIGSILGYDVGWTAGAIISGAYFGDKVSPLSDTTVLASSSCGVDIISHIRNMLRTSLPSMGIALIVFLIAGLHMDTGSEIIGSDIPVAISSVFNLSPWLCLIPVTTIALCVARVSSLRVLTGSAAMGLGAIFIFQPQIAEMVGTGVAGVYGSVRLLFNGLTVNTGSAMLDELLATTGVAGMLPTIYLVLSAMVFGGMLIGTGALSTITHSITGRVHRRSALVSATVATGLSLNAMTADQYLSIIIGSNIYRNAYRNKGYRPHLLSRTLEDSISVTSVLIPWNSCGIIQSTVLGVATLTYLPFCLFNYLSPLSSIAVSLISERLIPWLSTFGTRRLLPIRLSQPR